MREHEDDREAWTQVGAMRALGPEWARAVDALVDSHRYYMRIDTMVGAERLLTLLESVERRREQTAAAEAMLGRLAAHGY